MAFCGRRLYSERISFSWLIDEVANCRPSTCRLMGPLVPESELSTRDSPRPALPCPDSISLRR